MLEHTACPRCQAPNLATEYVCFACGAPLHPLRKRLRAAHAEAPWPLWVAIVLGLVLFALGAWKTADWLVAYRQRAGFPVWYWLGAGCGLLLIGQVAFYQARGTDRRWWRLKRAPKLPLAQAHAGDVIWTQGKVQCDTPLVAPYADQPCAYYQVVVREREPGESGWRTVQRETNAVDFTLAEEGDSVYIPSGSVLFDAPLYVDSYEDAGATQHVRVWALPVGMPASVCGKLEKEGKQPRLDPLGEDLPVVATWRSPDQYIALLAARARRALVVGWLVSVLAGLVLIAGLARA